MCATSPGANAQSYTLGDIFARLRVADSVANFAAVNPVVHARIAGLERYVRDHEALSMTMDQLSDIYAGSTPGYATVLRWNRNSYPRLPQDFRDSLVSVRAVAGRPLRPAVDAILGPAAVDSLYAPLDRWYVQMLDRAIARNTETLRRYSVKYGPGAPNLNLAEAALNYLAQLPRGSPFAGSDAGPSPLEIVAAYRTTDLTASQPTGESRAARLVTSAQLGLRLYRFNSDCGEGNRLRQLINPCHASGGAFLMGPSDTPLAQLWKAGRRGGAYAAWGNYHVGYVFDQERRLVFGLDTQVLPFLF